MSVVWFGRLAVVLVRLAALNFLAAAAWTQILEPMALGRGGTSCSVNPAGVSAGKTTVKAQVENQVPLSHQLATARMFWSPIANPGGALHKIEFVCQNRRAPLPQLAGPEKYIPLLDARISTSFFVVTSNERKYSQDGAR